MIDSGKRVIVFLDYGADTDRSVNYILPEFQMVRLFRTIQDRRSDSDDGVGVSVRFGKLLSA